MATTLTIKNFITGASVRGHGAVTPPRSGIRGRRAASGSEHSTPPKKLPWLMTLPQDSSVAPKPRPTSHSLLLRPLPTKTPTSTSTRIIAPARVLARAALLSHQHRSVRSRAAATSR
ncbi:hypothetical protein Ahy_A03g015218 isoform E [Arachis hypogaea]|uniref:Uncharacterized protein n=1 Tax=Arachis hypogaea TaxID=3818 RepID=A0A445E079_ARAHY|nr:hypothetical protein Ahy_A03g015218 isoform E [Arachis hypogaea]